MNLEVAQRNEDGEKGYVYDEYTECSKQPIHNQFEGNDLDHSCMEIGVKEAKPPSEDSAGSLRSRPAVDNLGVERNKSLGVAEQRKISTFHYTDEGPSNYCPGYFHGHNEHKRIYQNLYDSNSIDKCDQAELFRKIDELKDQLTRYFGVAEKPSEEVLDRTFPPPQEPSHCIYNHRSVPYGNSHALYIQDSCLHPRNVSNDFVGYNDSSQLQRLGKPPCQPPSQYLNQHFHGSFPGNCERHIDFNQDTFGSYRDKSLLCQPANSCLHCNQMGQNLPNPVNPISRSIASFMTCRQHSYKSRGACPLQTRSADSEIGSFDQWLPRRTVLNRESERVCCPIAGGAPFFTCSNCFQLLKLPRKIMARRKNQQKVQCGLCSAIISIQLGEKSLLVSIPTQLMQGHDESSDGSQEMLKEIQTSHNCLSAGDTNACSDDYDYSVYNFQLTESELSAMSREPKLNSANSSESPGLLSSSFSFSGIERSPDSVVSGKEISHSCDLALEDDTPSPLLNSPHQKEPDASSFNYAMNRCDSGSKIRCTDKEMLMPNGSSSRLNSVKKVPLQTEMEVHFNGYLNSSVSKISGEAGKEEDQPKPKERESFAGHVKKSLRDLLKSSQSMERGGSTVSINGKPMSDRVVKKAERLAGPIEPGNYWYDYQAGFWGVMGHPCLGIIPPLIEEFNYPMPVDCAGGNTGVFVNGRELHQEDLELLASRGLPTTRDKYYIIEISGRVFDEDSGEELDNLGKLAPTVENLKHGFGMKVPQALSLTALVDG